MEQYINLFDNTKFGDKFLTAENKQAVFLRFSENAEYKFAILYIEGWGIVQVFRHNGKAIYDDAAHNIVSKLEEHVSELLNTKSMIESYKQRLISQANGMKNSPLIDMCLASYKHGINETLDTLNLSNVQRTIKNRKEPVSEDLEEVAKYCISDE